MAVLVHNPDPEGKMGGLVHDRKSALAWYTSRFYNPGPGALGWQHRPAPSAAAYPGRTGCGGPRYHRGVGTGERRGGTSIAR